ncbi:sulfite exporter TauE/SafE family protein [Pedobacter nyackensis]|uniref:Probable membrane transporter protein n=1 Tax=Pedobacter nyackensis TaxID=475255 RepID=A0A1W2CJA2_9SPHI|nr:sulfite exporter TauE/SafE family protein [Pedobacter nyackensis]SMC85054.1 hypothetical protein SAMN04488101_10422 [Pedobacter nyackensis]
MEILAYVASAFIGISLGLTGGGGSILTVPVMVYLFGIDPLMATSYSLFVVGLTSLVGAYQNYKLGFIQMRTAFMFGLCSIVAVWLTRKLLIPIIPEHIFTTNHFVFTSHMFMMVLFAILMVAAAVSMIKGRKECESNVVPPSLNLPKMVLYGLGIGFTTGLLGAGGGFLLIPTLVVLMGLPMKEAIGTSLLIIALNSLIGFTADIGHFHMDWPLLLSVTGLAIMGVFAGGLLGARLNGGKLKIGFGWFVLVMGVFILLKELL